MTAKNEFDIGDKVLFDQDRIPWEAVVTHIFPPDEDHYTWTYGINITDSDYDDSRRPRESWWAYESQLSLSEWDN